jgi:hypothetical protein
VSFLGSEGYINDIHNEVYKANREKKNEKKRKQVYYSLFYLAPFPIFRDKKEKKEEDRLSERG